MQAIKPLHVLSIAALAAVSLTVAVRAGGDKVAFPADYAKGVLYTTVDRADNKQYRELYAPQAAIDAVKAGTPIPSGTALTIANYQAKLRADAPPRRGAGEAARAGKPIPSGTVLTMVNYKAKLGADGNPEKDANGRFIKT